MDQACFILNEDFGLDEAQKKLGTRISAGECSDLIFPSLRSLKWTEGRSLFLDSVPIRLPSNPSCASGLWDEPTRDELFALVEGLCADTAKRKACALVNRMNSSSSSPAHSSISTTAVVGGSTSNAALSADDFQFPSDLISIQDRKEEAMLGEFSRPSVAFNFTQLIFPFPFIWVSLFLWYLAQVFSEL